jgi:hypothetical protein
MLPTQTFPKDPRRRRHGRTLEKCELVTNVHGHPTRATGRHDGNPRIYVEALIANTDDCAVNPSWNLIVRSLSTLGTYLCQRVHVGARALLVAIMHPGLYGDYKPNHVGPRSVHRDR